MPFEYACFVSYRHSHADNELAERFISELEEALENELVHLMDEHLYVDRTRMKVSDPVEKSLAYALCHSACMIVVYTPRYFDANNTFCVREYRAMEKIEQTRLSRLRKESSSSNREVPRGLIIPVVFRGEKFLPSVLRDERHYLSFERFTLCSKEMKRNPQFQPYIREIVDVILTSRNLLDPWSDEFTCDCHSFVFPSEDEVKVWIEQNIGSIRNFPFRSRV